MVRLEASSALPTRRPGPRSGPGACYAARPSRSARRRPERRPRRRLCRRRSPRHRVLRQKSPGLRSPHPLRARNWAPRHRPLSLARRRVKRGTRRSKSQTKKSSVRQSPRPLSVNHGESLQARRPPYGLQPCLRPSRGLVRISSRALRLLSLQRQRWSRLQPRRLWKRSQSPPTSGRLMRRQLRWQHRLHHRRAPASGARRGPQRHVKTGALPARRRRWRRLSRSQPIRLCCQRLPRRRRKRPRRVPCPLLFLARRRSHRRHLWDPRLP